MRLLIEAVAVPMGSTIGYGRGIPENDPTKRVTFAGDARIMEALGEAMLASEAQLVADVPDWAILEIEELPER